MNMVISAIPVAFINPFSGRVDQMPLEMITAYVYDFSFLYLEEAARVACIRNNDAAANLLESIEEPEEN